ncbi:MAG: ATP-binding protein [Pseudomonadota bacterium]
MSLRAIMYISQEQHPFSTDDLRDLLHLAIDRNRENSITGHLHYESGYFMQYIEGEHRPVLETYRRIENDPRHAILHRVDIDIGSRRFPEWYMQWDEPSDLATDAAAVADLARTLKPFERVFDRDELDRVFTIYSRIAYDHLLRGFVAAKSESTELANIMSMAVHDLRAPVRSISALLDMYLADAGDKIGPEFVVIEKYIRSSLTRMEFLVDGILDHFEGEHQNRAEWVDIGPLIDEVTLTLKHTGRIGEVVYGALPRIRENPQRLWRVLSCLIMNGLKYNKAACPRVEISAERDDDVWRFCVQDNGIGIAPKYHERIFNMFTRLHDEGDYEGSGIGLATCRKLVEGWDGRIWVSSQVGTGSQFFFTVPMVAAEGPADAESSRSLT